MKTETKQEGAVAPIDLDRAIGMGEAAKLIRGKGGKLGIALDTVRRWANPVKGCKTPGGTLVLAAVRWSNQLLTLPEWVRAFEDARSRACGLVVTGGHSAARPQRARKAAHRRAAEMLDRAGVK